MIDYKLLCHWTCWEGLEYGTWSYIKGVLCNERGFNWRKGETMKVILFMIMCKYDNARL